MFPQRPILEHAVEPVGEGVIAAQLVMELFEFPLRIGREFVGEGVPASGVNAAFRSSR